MITNTQSGTNVHEISEGIYRINTPITLPGDMGQFSFNQYLIADDAPMLFHTGPRRMFPLVSRAIARVVPLERLRWITFGHVESDECGAMNEFLAVAPFAQPLASALGTMVSVNDVADRPGRGLADGEEFSIGAHRLSWIYTPHVPHGWDCGVLFDHSTQTLLCGDLFTQGGSDHPPVTEQEVLGPSERFRKPLDYFAHSAGSSAILEKLAALRPTTLACMHGSAFRGDGGALLRGLSEVLKREAQLSESQTV